MAQKLCQLKKKGGGELKETTIWTNSIPTSTMSGQELTLSESIENFQYIKLYFRKSTNNAAQSSVIYEKDTFKAFTGGASTDGFCGMFGERLDGSNCFRRFAYESSTKMRIFDGLKGTSSATNILIPVKICGLK